MRSPPRFPWWSAWLSCGLHAAVIFAVVLWPQRIAQSVETAPVEVSLELPPPATAAAPDLLTEETPEDTPQSDRIADNPAEYSVALSNYWLSVRAAIEANIRYPAEALRHHTEGTVAVRIRVAPDGGLASVDVLGDPPRALAETTLAAVRRAAPFPLPAEARGISLSAVLPVRFATRTR